MIHLDLFSGIGGFALATEKVWPNSKHIFCEIDSYCQALLKKQFEGSTIYGDIRQLTADTESTRQLRTEQYENSNQSKQGRCSIDINSQNTQSKIDILTGGFPCQPFSQAGKRRGTNDDRFLWPEMFRIIREFNPTWIIAENVRGLLTIEQGMVFEQVCLDLEICGYEVQPFIIPAVAVNAPHRRDRVWIVAYGESRRKKADSNAPDTTIARPHESKNPKGRRKGNERNSTRENKFCKPQRSNTLWAETTNWNQNWLEVATELCRVDDGLPKGLDFADWSKTQHRVERLKALGNAIVPQVAVEIMKAIKRGHYESE